MQPQNVEGFQIKAAGAPIYYLDVPLALVSASKR